MKYKLGFIVAGLLTILTACGNGSGKNEYENSPVNPLEQARPTIMVIPSDNLMKRYGAHTVKNVGGAEVNVFDYNKYLLANNDNKTILSLIAREFIDKKFPVQDLEQTLKQLHTQNAVDYADNISKDAKTELLTTASPDLVVELDYAKNINMRGDMNATYSYTLNVIDPYTNTVIATATRSDLEGENAEDAIRDAMKKDLARINKDITGSFKDILAHGRNVTVRINVDASSPINLDDRSITGDTYADWIVDYVKTHTVKGAYNLQRNTAKELYFVNCRIKLLNDDGTQYGVYDWARDMSDALSSNLGVESANKAQGLGEVVITIKGLK